jgi:hypothetical protein
MKAITAAAISAAAITALLAAAPAKADAPPTPPNNLHTVSVTDTDLMLAWNESADDSGAVNYAVFFDDNPTPFLTSGTPSLDVHLNRAIGMIPGSAHTFRVRAEDPSGNHSFSNTLTASFAPGDNTPPTAPRNLRVVSNTAAGVELAWDPSTDASRFDYRVNGTPCGSLPVSQGTTHVLIPGASDPVCGFFTATFTVVALDEFDNLSAPSNAVTVTAVR